VGWNGGGGRKRWAAPVDKIQGRLARVFFKKKTSLLILFENWFETFLKITLNSQPEQQNII
jgi:hypothetical protein